MKNYLFFILVFFLGETVCTQTLSVDSLINPETFNSVKKITDKAKILSKNDLILSNIEFKKALKISTDNRLRNFEGEILYLLAKNFLQLQESDTAISLFLKSASIRRELDDFLGLHKSLSNVCLIYFDKGMLNEGLLLVKESEVAAVKADYTRGIGIAKLQRGNFLLNLARYDEALQSYQQASENFKLLGYFDGVGMCLNNIASIYLIQENFPKALEYYMLNFNIQKKTGNLTEYAHAAANLGTYYAGDINSPEKSDRQNIDSMFYYFKLAHKLYVEQNNKLHVVKTTTNLGAAYILINNFPKASELFNISERLAIDEDYRVELARINRMKGLLFQKSRKYKDSEKFYIKAIEMSSSLNLREEEMMASYELAVTYDSLRSYNNSVIYYRKYMSLNDSLRGKESQRLIEQMTAKYDSKLKDEQIESAKIREKDLEEKNQAQAKFNAILKITILIVAFFLSVVIYSFIQKRKSNKLLIISNTEISKQKEIIEKKEKETTESIEYAKDIQLAMLPISNFIDMLFKDRCFVLFKPLNIVSGDFYWFGTIGKKKIFTAADCTGHGVPGALMSMLGMSFLKEIVTNADENINSTTIINKLRMHIINSLNQQGRDIRKDGMDMALAIYDEESRILDFSGAKNPLIIVREGNAIPNFYGIDRIKQQDFISTENHREYTIFQLQPDPMPVGYDERSHSFESICVTLQSGDTMYLFSDGYQDQFGGERDKKFMIKRLKQTFVDINQLDMKLQHQFLQEIFTKWLGSREQTDDVLVMGIKVL